MSGQESAKKSAVPEYKLTIGSSVEGKLKFDVEEIVVDELADGPSMAYARVNTHDLEWIDKADLKPTKPFKVDMGYLQSKEPPIPVFQGEIVGWEPLFHGKTPASVVVRAFNKLHPASRGRRTKAWLDKKLSDVASEIAGTYGMGTGGVESTTAVQPYIYQANITDLDFLRELAERVGYEVGCDVQNNLRFCSPGYNASEVATLKWEDNLKRFKGRFNTAQPVSKVKCVGWNVKDKKTFSKEGKKTDPDKMSGAKSGAEHAAKFEKASAELYIHNRPFYSPDDAEAEAKGLVKQLSMQLIIAEAECEGTAAAQAGQYVKIVGVGSRFEGKYYVIRARHILRPNSSLPDAGFVSYLTLRRSGANE